MARWVLEDFSDNIDIRDTDAGIQIRSHQVVAMTSRIKWSNFPSEVGKETSLLTLYVGDVRVWKGIIGFTATTPKFVCTADGASPVEHPTDYVDRRQVWESYGKWIQAPASWGGVDI